MMLFNRVNFKDASEILCFTKVQFKIFLFFFFPFVFFFFSLCMFVN